MPARNPDKNKDVIKELEKTISPILVVNNSALKPYVELFEYEPENIYQQPLGSLVGFFEIKEFSDESAYVVNFLTSVLKKEYYINPKRPVTESLDSALHKVNMALSELVKHGNIKWLGKINAAICVFEKNNTHFTVSGDAKIFLYRNQNLSEISADLASDSIDPNPLKTFVNVSSGRLELADRILISSADILQILPTNEIKKNIQRFEGEKFVQFLKTALSNQMEMVVSLVVEMTENVPVVAVKNAVKKESAQVANVFSEQTFANTPSSNTLADQPDHIVDAQDRSEPGYIDEKTGHIYVQGEIGDVNESSNPQMGLYWDMAKEKFTQSSYLAKNEIRKRFSLYKKQLAKKKELRRVEREKNAALAAEENKRLEEERVLTEIAEQEKRMQEEELRQVELKQQQEQQALLEIEQQKQQKILLAKQKVQQKELAAKNALLAKKLKAKTVFIEPTEIQPTKEAPARNPESNFLEKLRLAKIEQQRNAVIDLSAKSQPTQQQEIESKATTFAEFAEQDFELPNNDSKIEKLKLSITQNSKKILPLLKVATTFAKDKLTNLSSKNENGFQTESKKFNLIPHFSRIKSLFKSFSAKQKAYTAGALFLIFIVPFFIVHFLNKSAAPIVAVAPVVAPTQAELLANEKNISLNTKAQSTFSNQNIVTALIANENPTIITKTSVVVLSNNQPTEFPLPANSGTPVKVAYMQDLSLVLIITDSGKVISFSPISTKFADNNINLTNISKESFIGTYLTYLYVLDQKNNQINRFPRADGGFGESTSWLKDGASFATTKDMTIDDNIYTVTNNQVLKFFKGKKVDFSLEASSTPVQFDKIYTTPELQNFYALDNKNSRVIQYSKDGKIIAQFYNELIKDGTSLSVDEQNKTAYITTAAGLLSVSLQ